MTWIEIKDSSEAKGHGAPGVAVEGKEANRLLQGCRFFTGDGGGGCPLFTPKTLCVWNI